MKPYYIIAACALLCFSSCKFAKKNGSNSSFKTSEKNGQIVKTTSIENDSLTLFVEYSGVINFNADRTVITGISPEGYLKYRKNDKELSAKNDGDGIQFELSDHGRELRSLLARKKLIAEAFAAIKYTDSLRNQPKKDKL